jgi:hypothetical protein
MARQMSELEDSDLNVEPMIVSVDYALWCDIRTAFDDRAVVIEFHTMLGANATIVDIPVDEWIWPIPALSSYVIVYQPDAPLFLEKIADLGVTLPESPEFLDADVEDSVVMTHEMFDMPCPVCGLKELVIENIRAQSMILALASQALKMELTFEPCTAHGGHLFLDGEPSHGLRCSACINAFAHSPKFATRLILVMEVQ